jgi:hypothetical protein
MSGRRLSLAPVACQHPDQAAALEAPTGGLDVLGRTYHVIAPARAFGPCLLHHLMESDRRLIPELDQVPGARPVRWPEKAKLPSESLLIVSTCDAAEMVAVVNPLVITASLPGPTKPLSSTIPLDHPLRARWPRPRS